MWIDVSLDGKWRMIIIKDINSHLLIEKPATIRGEVDITFTASSLSEGFLFGNTPTNEIGESLYKIGENQSITISSLAMTKVMETSWGLQFIDNILRVKNYFFDNAGNLNLKTETRILVFTKNKI